MFDTITFVHTYDILLVPCLLMVVDYFTGVVQAWVNKNINSSKLRSGLVKKLGEVIAVAVPIYLEHSMHIPPAFVKFLSLYIVVMELISIIENLGKMGVNLPDWLLARLTQVQDKLNDDPTKEE